MNMRLYLFAIVAGLLLGRVAPGQIEVTLQPDEASSKDVFVYELAVPGVFNIPTAARVTNMDSETLNPLDPPAAVPFGNFLGSSNTNPLTGALGEERAHDTRTLIQFDLSGLAISPSDVTGAQLAVFATQGLPPFADPTPTDPVTTELSRVLEAWSETTVTFETQPAVSAPITSTVQDSAEVFVTFDVTDLVKDWIADPGSNHGVRLSQPDIITNAEGLQVASLYFSSAHADPALRPFLQISAVPEPASATLLILGNLAVLFASRRARK